MPQLITLKIYKSWDGRDPEKTWVNTYDMLVQTETLEDALIPTAVDYFVNMEKAFHLNRVNFVRAVVSTYEREPVYDPFQLRVRELSGVGNKGIVEGDSPLDLNIALMIKRNGVVGRSGRMYWRGCLLQSEIEMGSGGKTVLTTAAEGNISAGIPNAISFVANDENVQWLLLPEKPDTSGTPQTFRTVHSIGVGGVVINKRNHRYFDRASTPAV